MLIKIGILIVLVLASFIFLGIKISENIKQQEIKMLFFSLYGMTIFTLFNLVVSVYFFAALRHKRGPAGPKGKKGEMGDKGTNSACDQVSCLKKSLQNIIVNYLENRIESPPTVPKAISLNGKQRTMICSMTKKLKQSELEKILKKDKLLEINGELNNIKIDTKTEDFKGVLVEIAGILGSTIAQTDIDDTFCN